MTASKDPDVAPEHRTYLTVASQVTTPLVTYVETEHGSRPIDRGTGFFLQHGNRAFVITNAHVLESYAAGKRRHEHVAVQVWSGESKTGKEIHAGYQLAPNSVKSTAFGVSSHYAHKDVGLVELTGDAADLVRREKSFVQFEDLDVKLPVSGSVVFYKGYPRNSVEFHGPIRSAHFGQWLDVRMIENACAQVIIARPSIAQYRSQSFEDEDGKDLKGISGSALFNDSGHVVGVVWGGDPDHDAIWAVPAATIQDLILKYEAKRS